MKTGKTEHIGNISYTEDTEFVNFNNHVPVHCKTLYNTVI